jgi:shikimate kinase
MGAKGAVCAVGQGLYVTKNWAMSVIPAKSYPHYVLAVVPGQRSSERLSTENPRSSKVAEVSRKASSLAL